MTYPFKIRGNLFDPLNEPVPSDISLYPESVFNEPKKIGINPNDFFPLRAAQLYDPNQLNAQAPNAPIVSAQDPMSIDQRLAQLYQPQTQMSEAYKQALMQIPQPQEPGKLRTIAAILGGLGAGAGPSHYYGGNAVGFSGNPKAALETTDLIRNAPYYKAMEQYGVRTKALGAGAALEERQNAERARTAETTLLREQQMQTQQERERHNQEVEALNQQKSDQIYETKIQKLQQDLDIAERKAQIAEGSLAQRTDNANARLELNRAQLDALNARHALDVAQKEKQLDEMKRLHDTMAAKWSAEAADREAKIKQYEEALGLKKQPVTTQQTTKDAAGNVTETKTTVRGTGTVEPQKMQKEIPGIPGSLAESTDGGKTWRRIK